MSETISAEEYRIQAARALPNEHEKQKKFFEWANNRNTLLAYPDAEWLYASANGGKRHIKVASKLKQEGVKSGVWDISLDVAKGKFSGLRIEMKHGKNGLSPTQKTWKKHYLETGKKCVVCYSHVEAVDAFVKYVTLT